MFMSIVFFDINVHSRSYSDSFDNILTRLHSFCASSRQRWYTPKRQLSSSLQVMFSCLYELHHLLPIIYSLYLSPPSLSQNSFSGDSTVGSSSAALNKGKCVTLCSALIRVIPADPTNQSRCAQESTPFPWHSITVFEAWTHSTRRIWLVLQTAAIHLVLLLFNTLLLWTLFMDPGRKLVIFLTAHASCIALISLL